MFGKRKAKRRAYRQGYREGVEAGVAAARRLRELRERFPDRDEALRRRRAATMTATARGVGREL